MHIGQTALGRRTLLKATVLGAALSFTPAYYRRALAAPTSDGDGPYGPLRGAPDANGVYLPEGFSSRLIGVSGEPVNRDGLLGMPLPGEGYLWHGSPDGAACFPDGEGGYHYVCNAEESDGNGGCGAVHFAGDGTVLDAYPVLRGTSRNCAGGATPWGTWLSCEENGDDGLVWECAPDGSREGKPLRMLGSFNHEAVAVDPVNEHLFLTEDSPDGRFYRWRMASGRFDCAMCRGQLTADGPDDGELQAARVDDEGRVEWITVPDPTERPLRHSSALTEATPFNGGEGIWYDTGYVYFTTKGDNHVWAHDIARQTITPLYDPADFPDGAPLTGVDNVTIAPSGDVLIAEDGGDLEIRLISADERELAPLLRLTADHSASEITGPCFSPDGSRLYFSSQRGGALSLNRGVTYEISGPFRLDRVGVAATGETPETYDPAPHSPGSEGANRTDLDR